VAIEHTRHRFGNVFPTDLSTAYNAGIVGISGSGKVKGNESGLTRSNGCCQKLILLGCPRYKLWWSHGW